MQFILGMSCGTIERDGLVSHIIAAGGKSSNQRGRDYVNTAFIYNVEEDIWTTGLTSLITKGN